MLNLKEECNLKRYLLFLLLINAFSIYLDGIFCVHTKENAKIIFIIYFYITLSNVDLST